MDIQHDIESVKKAHVKLVTEVLSDRLTNEARKRAFIVDAEKLVEDIEICSSQAGSLDDYKWLSTAAVQWQAVFYSILGIPKTITLSSPDKTLNLRQHTSFVDDHEVGQWIHSVAHYNSTIRRAQNILYEIGDILQKSQEINSSDEDKASDWTRATVHFASEIIDGKIDIERLGADTYHRLESVWLEDVKELKAYFVWSRMKGATKENYFSACEQIRDRLLTLDKGGLRQFERPRNYIHDRYVTNGEISPHENLHVRSLIREKARHIWQLSGDSEVMSWASAETYTKAFYENIVPAVESKNKERALSVLRTFERFPIINCFEAAIAIYFLDAEMIREMFDQQLITRYMIL